MSETIYLVEHVDWDYSDIVSAHRSRVDAEAEAKRLRDLDLDRRYEVAETELK